MNEHMQLHAHRVIERPVSDVWSVLADYRRDTEWRSGVTEMTSTCHPVRPGAETSETMQAGGRTCRNRGVVDEVVEQRILAWHTVEGVEAYGRRSTAAVDGGRTTVRLELAVRPRGVERLMAPILRRMLQRNLEGDLGRLADLVVGESTERP